MYLSATRGEREGRFISDVSRGSVQDTLRGCRLRHPIFGPRTRGSPKTYYLIYDSHGHYLLATKWTSRFFDTIRVCIPAGVKEKGEPFSRTRNEHKRHAQAQPCAHSFAVVATSPRTEEDFCLRFLITRASTRRGDTAWGDPGGAKSALRDIIKLWIR